MSPWTLSTSTRLASNSNGMPRAMVRADSTLPFQATTAVLPIVSGAPGAATSTGRPLSNSAASQVSRQREEGDARVRPMTIRSNRRPCSPTISLSRPCTSRQPAVGPSAAVSISQNGRPLSRVIFRKSVRAPSANCRHSPATVDRYSGGMDMPGINAPNARFGWPNTSNPSRWLMKRFARRIAVFSALRAASSS